MPIEWSSEMPHRRIQIPVSHVPGPGFGYWKSPIFVAVLVEYVFDGRYLVTAYSRAGDGWT